MNQDLLYQMGSLAGTIPYFTILVILVHYVLRRARHKRAIRRGPISGFYPSSVALGTIFLLSSMLFRPRLQYAIEAREVEQADEDDDGGPDSPGKLDKQLRRIRGEPVDTLVLRL